MGQAMCTGARSELFRRTASWGGVFPRASCVLPGVRARLVGHGENPIPQSTRLGTLGFDLPQASLGAHFTK